MTARRLFFSILVGLFGASCSMPQSASFNGTSAATSDFAQAPQDRPGLGTKWGETRRSASSAAIFLRATPTRPLATAEIFYDDRAGIEAMAAASEFRRVWPNLRGPVASLVSIGLKEQSGRFLPGAIVADRWFVVGQEGRR